MVSATQRRAPAHWKNWRDPICVPVAAAERDAQSVLSRISRWPRDPSQPAEQGICSCRRESLRKLAATSYHWHRRP